MANVLLPLPSRNVSGGTIDSITPDAIADTIMVNYLEKNGVNSEEELRRRKYIKYPLGITVLDLCYKQKVLLPAEMAIGLEFIEQREGGDNATDIMHATAAEEPDWRQRQMSDY